MRMPAAHELKSGAASAGRWIVAIGVAGQVVTMHADNQHPTHVDLFRSRIREADLVPESPEQAARRLLGRAIAVEIALGHEVNAATQARRIIDCGDVNDYEGDSDEDALLELVADQAMDEAMAMTWLQDRVQETANLLGARWGEVDRLSADLFDRGRLDADGPADG